jgi:rhamnose utilization protein RhaD (predicted bifunctional aldolase and dehydrogenase)
LEQAVARIDDYLATCRRGRPSPGPARFVAPAPDERRRLAERILPAVRGALGTPERVILSFDDGEDVLATLAAERTGDLVRRGMGTPEHLLRAGRLPIWLDLDLAMADDQLAGEVRTQIQRARSEYLAYHARQARTDERPLDDWAKVVLVPSGGR